MSKTRILTTTRIALLICFIASAFTSLSQNLSNKGREFWVGYGHHQFFEGGGSQFNIQNLVIYLSAEEPATVTVSLNGTSYSATYSVPANSVISTPPFPKAGLTDARLWNSGTSEGLFNKGIRILSDVPIVAYAHIYGSASSGATMLMPVDTWGYSYISVNSEQRYANNCYSWMYVVAKEDNTKVTITPSVPTRGGKPAGVPFDVVMNRGEIYQVLGAIESGSDGYQLTGTTVHSVANSDGECHPVAVFSGSSRTSNPALTCSGGGGDNDMQQLFPSQAWGKRYLTAPTSRSSNPAMFQTNGYKVVVKDPSTKVWRNGVLLDNSTLINNTYYRFESNVAEYIEADQPVMVAQFMTGGQCMGGSGNVGDPEMIYISPIEQGIERIGFYKNTLQNINFNYLTLIIPNAGLASLTIDGQTGATAYNHSYAHPNLAGYTVVIKRWNASQGQCIVQSDEPFTAITYGLGSVESYGYNAGTLINNLNVIGNVYNPLDTSTNSHQYTCQNTAAELSMYVAYKPTNMYWYLSDISSLAPNANVDIPNPVPVDSMLQNGTWYYQYQLPGTYTFSDTGFFTIRVRNTHPMFDNCNNTEEVSFTVNVRKNPKPDYSITHTGCIADIVQFNSPANTGNGYTIDTWNWSFADGTTEDISNPEKLFTTPGTHSVSLNVVTTEGCVGDTTFNIDVFDRPTVTFDATPLSVCEGGNISFTNSSSYSGNGQINNYYWDFGNGSTTNAGNNDPQTITYETPGNYTVRHVVEVTSNCISDTATKVITVYAKPEISISYPDGCLPVDGVVQFSNNTTTPDGQVINHAWNFGDNNASGSNPNTSTLESPSHAYSVGNYTIQYTATTANGCVKDTTFTTSFNIKPLLDYAPQLPAVCENQTGTISVAGGTVTNGVTGQSLYHGPGTDAQGNFTPSAAGAGTHTIWYVFQSDGGCRDSLSSSITVHPKPVSSFQLEQDICLNEVANLVDASTIPSGTITQWTWDFGNNNTMSMDDGNPFTYSFPAYSAYTVKLVTTSDEGCISDTAFRTINVHPLPVADFELPAAVCMPGGGATFTNQSTVAQTAAMSYNWDFGDGQTSSNTNPTNYYNSNGPFQVRLTATTAFGCAHDTSKLMSSFYDKPVAEFSVTPDTLCQGSDNVFTDLSSAPNSTIQSWTWSFGDGTSSNEKDPVKQYSAPGNYQVNLIVKNEFDCISDVFTDEVIVYLQPVIDAGPSFVVPQGTQVTFNPTANDTSSLNFLWTPAGYFTDPTQLRPTIVANVNQQFTLTATGLGNCSASDTMSVKILRPVTVPNSFSPNGDGINDNWIIPNLHDYPGCTVEVYNRYGMLVYKSNGYGNPWNGTYKGSPLPFGTYYYVITLKNGFQPMTGSVTIVR